ncbi:MAG: DHH family phosphoesterase [Clostridia bacterium]|nr:DHH family phosphoesterase [Clostridia bacterium]
MKKDKFIFKLMTETRLYFVAVIVSALIALFYENYGFVIFELLLLGGMIAYHVISVKKKTAEIRDYIKNLSMHSQNAARDSMLNTPMPLTVLDLTGKIVWHNDVFAKITDGRHYEKHISDVVPGIEILKILENRHNINLNIKFKDRIYQITGNVVEFIENDIKLYTLVLYWTDRTREAKFVKKYNDSRVLNCIVLVDNYEDITKGISQQEIGKFSSAMDHVISNWVMENEGTYRKLEKDRYYILFENKNIRDLVETKFEILNEVKKVETENSIQPTLSIGIGDAETIQKSEEYAKISLDMALGRGGDQAVIKYDDSFKFFGGNSESVGRNTKVRSRVVAHALRELIQRADVVFITGHKNSDADSLGASVGVCKMASLFEKKAYVIIGEMQSATKRLVDELKKEDAYKDVFIPEQTALQMEYKNPLLVVVDTHNPFYVDAPKLVNEVENIVLIDHHRRGEKYIDKPVLTFHEPYASSACEMITEVFQYIKDGAKLSPKEAQAVYAGMVLDTKNFSMKTGVRTFEAASFLRRMGVDTVNVKRIFQNDMSMYLKRAKIVANADTYLDKFAISYWDEVETAANIIASQAADELLNITDIKASFVLCRTDDGVTVSARSLGEYNVQLVMEKVGGGGHMTIAGAQFKNKTIMEVLDILRHAIEELE